jgi:hypothetical protein
MGIQALFQAPTLFAQKDPEYCALVIGILHGTLRKS